MECIIDESLDGRRRIALNRKVEDMAHNKWLLEGLLLSLRLSKDQCLTNILDLVNSNAPHHILAASISEALMRVPKLATHTTMNPFLADQGQIPRNTFGDQTSKNEYDVWYTDNTEPFDPMTLSQKLTDFARNTTNFKTTPGWPVPGNVPLAQDLSSNQIHEYWQENIHSRSLVYRNLAPSGINSLQTMHQTQSMASEDIRLEDVVLWMKNIALQNNTGSATVELDNFSECLFKSHSFPSDSASWVQVPGSYVASRTPEM
jgi:hypothetical protein